MLIKISRDLKRSLETTEFLIVERHCNWKANFKAFRIRHNKHNTSAERRWYLFWRVILVAISDPRKNRFARNKRGRKKKGRRWEQYNFNKRRYRRERKGRQREKLGKWLVFLIPVSAVNTSWMKGSLFAVNKLAKVTESKFTSDAVCIAYN